MVKGIDKFHTGFVTQTELDDIIKIICPDLVNRCLRKVIIPFCAVQNRILVMYRNFFEYILTSLKKLDFDYQEIIEKEKERVKHERLGRSQSPLMKRSQSIGAPASNSRLGQHQTITPNKENDSTIVIKEMLKSRKQSVQP
jgi:hypothetical protein